MHKISSPLHDGDYEQDVDSDDIPGDGEAAPTEHTPNNTPLPRGPPPPHTVQRDRPLSHAVSMAVQNALHLEGGHTGRGTATLASVRIELTHLTDATADHPNVLFFNDSNDEDDGEADHVGPGRDRTGGGDDTAAQTESSELN